MEKYVRNVIKSLMKIILKHCSFYRGTYLFKPRPGEQPKDHKFYRSLYPQIIQDIEVRLLHNVCNIKISIYSLKEPFLSLGEIHITRRRKDLEQMNMCE